VHCARATADAHLPKTLHKTADRNDDIIIFRKIQNDKH